MLQEPEDVKQYLESLVVDYFSENIPEWDGSIQVVKRTELREYVKEVIAQNTDILVARDYPVRVDSYEYYHGLVDLMEYLNNDPSYGYSAEDDHDGWYKVTTALFAI